MTDGSGVVRASDAGTAVFVVVAVAAALARRAFSTVALVVSLGLFGAGCLAFLAAYALAVRRSRTDAIGMGGLFLLQGTAPKEVRRRLLGALALQVLVAVGTAAAHPFTSQAFVILAPMFGLGMAGLWAALYGRFAPR